MGAGGVAAGAAVAGSAASIGGTIMNARKGSGGSSAGTSQIAPWSPQQPLIENGLSNASGIYNNRIAQGPFTGEMVAPGNSTQQGAVNYGSAFSNGLGGNLVNGLYGTSGTLEGASQPFVGNAENMASNGIQGPNSGLMGTLQGYGTGGQQINGANPALAGALNTAAINSANGLGGFQNTLSQAANAGLSNPTQQVEQNAQTYANAPQVQASLAATNNAINQTLNEQTLPQQNERESMGGALDSSRSGMAQGMAQQAAATAEGQADASIENNAYNTGMSEAGSLYQSGLNTATTAGMYGFNDLSNNANTQAGQQIGLGEANATNAMSAANAGLGQGLNFENANANAMLGANAQLGSATSYGLNGAGDTMNAATGNFSLGSAAGTLQQSMQQAGDTNAYDQWNMSNQYDQGVLQAYMGVVGTPYGSQGVNTNEVQNPQNIPGAGLGGALAGLGLANQSGLFANSNGANNPGLFGAGGLFSSSGNGLFSSNGTAPSASNPNAIVPGYSPTDNSTYIGFG